MAKRMIFTAQIVTGSEAYAMGLVEEVVPANQECNAAYLKALEIATEIKSKVYNIHRIKKIRKKKRLSR